MGINSDKKIFLYYYDISNYSLDELYAKLPSCFNGFEEQKIKRYKKEDDQKRSLIGKIAIAKKLSNILNVNETEFIFERNSFGKPILKKSVYENLDFNISHSGKYVLVVLNVLGKVGVDVEKIKTINLKIADNIFVENEILYVKKNKEEIFEKFFQLWTLKESFIKALGKGLSFPLKSFNFEFKNGRIIHKINSKETKWNFKEYNIDRNYKVAVCARKGEIPKNIIKDKLF